MGNPWAGVEVWKTRWTPSLQAEEDKEEQTDSQLDASSSQTVTPVAEPLSTEPTPPDGPTPSLGPLDLLSREELLTDTSNSSSSTGEEGEEGMGGLHSFSLVIPKSGPVRLEALVPRAHHADGQGCRSDSILH